MRAVLALTAALAGCQSADETFTLYRGSVTGPMKIHVATFDTSNGAVYNQENCEIARALFAGQRGVRVRYWCEHGAFRP